MHGCSTHAPNDKCERDIPNSEYSSVHQTGPHETDNIGGHNEAPSSRGLSRSLTNDYYGSSQDLASRRRQAEERIDECETSKWRRLDRSSPSQHSPCSGIERTLKRMQLLVFHTFHVIYNQNDRNNLSYERQTAPYRSPEVVASYD